jgi:hypothetical protein
MRTTCAGGATPRPAMHTRVFFVAFTAFAVSALLGAGFALVGPIALVRIFGVVALIAGAAGCALQLYALREFAPRAHALLLRRLRGGADRVRTAAMPPQAALLTR